MPRRDQFETVYDGSVHHITQRGLNKSRIFKTDEDCASFISLIGRYVEQFKIEIYNYCIMPNHLHMLISVEEARHLSKFMQALALSYSSFYRRKYKYTGYLWQGRYNNFPIDKDSYLLECARYIERNPLRAKPPMVEDLSLYRWSSYNFYAMGVPDNIITVNPLYEAMGKTPKDRQSEYRKYILTPRPYEELLDDVFNV